MSKHLVNLVYAKVCGSAARKAVLVAMADRASDDGSGVYVSKMRIAAETELSRSTVISVTKEFEREGVVTAVGKRAGNHGFTIVYHLSVAKISALPDAWGKCSDLNTLDPALGEEPEAEAAEVFEVSDHRTLKKIQVFKSPTSSVQLSDKNRPYRTIDSKKVVKGKKPLSDLIALKRWELEREIQRNPPLATQLQAELTALEDQQFTERKSINSKR